MRTAIFYSCKGGSGRTLTLANMAALLVRLGHDVLAVDFDLEAPGLPEAFHDLTPTAETATNKGLVDYARAWLEEGPIDDADALIGERSQHGAVRSVSERPRLPIIEFTQASNGKPRSPKGPRLRLVRAGDYVDSQSYDAYAEFMRRGYLEALYPLPPIGLDVPRDKQGAGEAEYMHNYRAFWGELREQLALDPPDHLMIDTRTGFSPLSATTIDAFLGELAGHPATRADLFVFTDRGSEASRLGTQAFIRQIGRRHQNPTIPRRTWVVRREQALAESVQATRTQSPEEWLSAGTDDVAWTEVIDAYFRLHSDPEVELTGMSLASPHKELVHRALLDDYVKLATLLIEGQTEAEVRTDLGLGRATGYKLFKLPGTGGMFSVADSEPNVSFTETTFHSLVAHLVSGPVSPRSLADAGRSAGVAFATKFKSKAPDSRVKALDRWVELESASGWGVFELDPELTADFLVGTQGRRIRVIRNAFAPPPKESHANLCAYLGGYLAGILSTLTDSQVETDPDRHVLCRSHGIGTEDICEFEFTASAPIASGTVVARVRPKICLIYTGGTIGMKRDYQGTLQPPKNRTDFLRFAPELREIVEYDFVPLLNKDSTNVLPEDWKDIAKAIYDRRDGGYAGFVVVHGTDTMHFSAAAVAFALGPGASVPGRLHRGADDPRGSARRRSREPPPCLCCRDRGSRGGRHRVW